MKKLIALLSVFILVTSCTLENNNRNVYFELLPVDSVIIASGIPCQYRKPYRYKVFKTNELSCF